MPRLRAVWATAQFLIAVAAAGWGLFLLVSTHETIWGSGNLAAAIFFLVTGFLFAANHPDGRVVGLFGIVVFVLVNAWLVYTFATDGLARLALNPTWTKAQVGAVMVLASLLIAVPEAILLLFGHGERPDAEPLATAPPPM